MDGLDGLDWIDILYKYTAYMYVIVNIKRLMDINHLKD